MKTVVQDSALQLGDQVELISVPMGRAGRLRVGMRGEVVVPSAEFNWCSVIFPETRQRGPFLLAPRHLKLVERPVPPPDAA